MDTIAKIDALIRLDEPERTAGLMALKNMMDQVSMSTVCDQEEIKWPVLRFRFNLPNILRAIFAGPSR